MRLAAYDLSGNAGHETAVASLAAGLTQGVAKNSKIVPIRIYDCYGVSTSENWNFAFDWIMSPSNRYFSLTAPAVVNLSGSMATCDPDLTYFENEVNSMVGHPYGSGGCQLPSSGQWPGIPVVVAAGNFGTSQPFLSPARMAFSNTSFGTCGHVISAGATDRGDQRWQCTTQEAGACARITACNDTYVTTTPASNFGPTVDIYAPGANVTPATQTGTADYVTQPFRKSGTSYASPIVAGVIARLMQAEGAKTCDQAWQRVQETATNVIDWDPKANGLPKPLVNRR